MAEQRHRHGGARRCPAASRRARSAASPASRWRSAGGREPPLGPADAKHLVQDAPAFERLGNAWVVHGPPPGRASFRHCRTSDLRLQDAPSALAPVDFAPIWAQNVWTVPPKRPSPTGPDPGMRRCLRRMPLVTLALGRRWPSPRPAAAPRPRLPAARLRREGAPASGAAGARRTRPGAGRRLPDQGARLARGGGDGAGHRARSTASSARCASTRATASARQSCSLRIDPERYRLEAERAKAATDQAIAELGRAQADLKRREALAQNQLVVDRGADALARRERAPGRPVLDVSKAAYEIALQNQRRSEVRPPTPASSTRAPSTPASSSARAPCSPRSWTSSRLRLRFKVSEGESLRANEGGQVSFRVEPIGPRDFSAQIYHVGKVADPHDAPGRGARLGGQPGRAQAGLLRRGHARGSRRKRARSSCPRAPSRRASAASSPTSCKEDTARLRPVQIGLRTGHRDRRDPVGPERGRGGGLRGLGPAGGRHGGRAGRQPTRGRGRAKGATMSAEAQRGPPRCGRTPTRSRPGMTLADISIRNHVFAWILMFALIGFGLLCFTGFGSVFQRARRQPEPRRRLPGRQRLGHAGRAPPPRSWRRTSSTSSRTRSPRSRAIKEISSIVAPGPGQHHRRVRARPRHRRRRCRTCRRKIAQAQRRLPRRDRPADRHARPTPRTSRSCGSRSSGSRPPTVARRLRHAT